MCDLLVETGLSEAGYIGQSFGFGWGLNHGASATDMTAQPRPGASPSQCDQADHAGLLGALPDQIAAGEPACLHQGEPVFGIDLPAPDGNRGVGRPRQVAHLKPEAPVLGLEVTDQRPCQLVPRRQKQPKRFSTTALMRSSEVRKS
jgi:hypothetical protein